MSFSDFLCHSAEIFRPVRSTSPHGEKKITSFASQGSIRARLIASTSKAITDELTSSSVVANYKLLFLGDLREGDRVVVTDVGGQVIAYPFRVTSVLKRNDRGSLRHQSALLDAWKEV